MGILVLWFPQGPGVNDFIGVVIKISAHDQNYIYQIFRATALNIDTMASTYKLLISTII